MLNNIVLVGRLVRDLEVRETEKGKKVSTLTLAIPRSFKNVNGEYDTDFIDCILWEGIAENTAEFCHKGDILGIKGRVQSRVVETEQGNKYFTDIVAEKVTFLSTNKNKQTEEEK